MLRLRPAGFWRWITRRVVGHPKVVVTVGIVLWLALGVAVCSWSLDFAGRDGEPRPGLEWLRHARTWAGWALIPVSLGWQRLWIKFCEGDVIPPGGSKPAHPTLAGVKHRRIHEREPVPRGLLPWFGGLGAVGIGVGVLITLWVPFFITGGTGRAFRGLLVLLAGLGCINVYCGVRVLRDVLFLANDDYFIAGREEQVAAEIAAAERKTEEGDRDYERRSLRGWPFKLIYIVFILGTALLFKSLSEAEGVTAFQTSLSALFVTVAWIYTARLRPRHWRLARALTLAGAATFQVFTIHTWGLHCLPMGLGLVWGSVIATVGTRLHLRKLAGGPARMQLP